MKVNITHKFVPRGTINFCVLHHYATIETAFQVVICSHFRSFSVVPIIVQGSFRFGRHSVLLYSAPGYHNFVFLQQDCGWVNGLYACEDKVYVDKVCRLCSFEFVVQGIAQRITGAPTDIFEPVEFIPIASHMQYNDTQQIWEVGKTWDLTLKLVIKTPHLAISTLPWHHDTERSSAIA